MSLWIDLDMDQKITQVLDVQSGDLPHAFGRPFLTSYQIAIRFQQMFPQDFETIGKPIGGKGIGQHDSLAQYIAGELSRRIKSGAVTTIEGALLHRAYLQSLKYEANHQLVESSSEHAYDLSMYRLVH